MSRLGAAPGTHRGCGVRGCQARAGSRRSRRRCIPEARRDPNGGGVASAVATAQAAPLPREGHPLIEQLAGLWDQRETLHAPIARRFQEILDRSTSSKPSAPTSRTRGDALDQPHRVKTHIKLMLDDEAVTIRCVNQGRREAFPPREARRGGGGEGRRSTSFPQLRAVRSSLFPGLRPGIEISLD